MKRPSVLALTILFVVLSFFVRESSRAQAADFPVKGRPITVIVPYPAGGATDIAARMVADVMKNELGTSIQVVNKPGATSQVGMTELVRSKPDGYTISASPLPAVILTYLDPERKAIYTSKSFQPLANVIFPPLVLSVKADSPYKTLQDLVVAAKAKPETLKIASAGVLSNNHLAILQFEKVSSTRLAIVHFDGGAAGMNALLGGHVEATVGVLPEVLSHFKNGAIRPLGVMDARESKFLPGVKTMEAQGLKLYVYGATGMAAPAGTPRPVVDILTAAIKKACENESFLKKMDDMGFPIQYMDPEGYAKFWSQVEVDVAPLMNEAKAGGK
jgi:tripartite-type tricarboxylate transporter receptor subunit TctC